jgi:S-layer domain
MKTAKIVAALAVLLLTGTALSQTSTSTASATELDAVLLTTDPVPLRSGEDADLSFHIVNNGTLSAEGVSAEIVDSYPFSLKPDRQRSYELGRVTPGEEYQISTDILVAQEASEGSHNLKVRLSKDGFSRIVEIPVEVQSDDIDLNLANLRTTPDELRPDTEDNKLTVSIVNNGDKDAENVVLDLEFPEFIEERSSFSTRQSLGNLKSGRSKQAEFFFDTSEDAPSGSFEVDSSITYTEDDSTADIEKEQSFNVFMSGKPQYEVVNTSSDLEIGQQSEVRVTVRNTGNEESTSTRIRVLDSSDLPFSYRSSSQFVGTLEPGQQGQAVFRVTPESNAVEKEYLLDFEIRGVKDTEVFTSDTTLSLPVASQTSESGSSGPPILGIAAALGLAVLGFLLYRRKNRGSEDTEDSDQEQEGE